MLNPWPINGALALGAMLRSGTVLQPGTSQQHLQYEACHAGTVKAGPRSSNGRCVPVPLPPTYPRLRYAAAQVPFAPSQ